MPLNSPTTSRRRTRRAATSHRHRAGAICTAQPRGCRDAPLYPDRQQFRLYLWRYRGPTRAHVFKAGEWEGNAARDCEITPALAAQWIDEAEVGAYGRTYETLSVNPRDTSTGYHVYRADIDGSDAVVTVRDGQDQDTINAVVESCAYVGFVRCHDAADA